MKEKKRDKKIRYGSRKERNRKLEKKERGIDNENGTKLQVTENEKREK